VASLALNGLLDWVGSNAYGEAPLLQVLGQNWHLSRLSDWIPRWENDHHFVTLLAPWNQRGLALRIEPRRAQPVRVRGSLEYLALRRLREERIDVFLRASHDPATASHIIEARTDHTLLALGLHCDTPPTQMRWGEQFELEFSGPVTLFVALAPEADGARLGAQHLRQVGWEELLRRTVAKLETLTAGHAWPLPEVYKRHLLFAYFYAQADSLEGPPVLLPSRSPQHPSSGAFRARDSLLWFFPALLKADRKRARAVLKATLERYAGWPGERAHYLGGPPLQPGFALDQAAAYPLMLARYLEGGPDPELLSQLKEPIEEILEQVHQERHISLPLYKTAFSPTDDPPLFPYLTYSNALWAAALDRLSAFWPDRDRLKIEARAVRETLHRQAVQLGRYVYAFDPSSGKFQWADEPAGSLLLLPHLGFTSAQDPTWQETALWILSEANTHHHAGQFPGEGSAHSPFPTGWGLGNRLLSGLRRMGGEALNTLEKAPLDSGYACESFDAATGAAKTETGHAALAGFIAYALREVGTAGSG
jgi:hypothetical protein